MTRPGAAPTRGSGGRTSPWREGFPPANSRSTPRPAGAPWRAVRRHPYRTRPGRQSALRRRAVASAAGPHPVDPWVTTSTTGQRPRPAFNGRINPASERSRTPSLTCHRSRSHSSRSWRSIRTTSWTPPGSVRSACWPVMPSRYQRATANRAALRDNAIALVSHFSGTGPRINGTVVLRFWRTGRRLPISAASGSPLGVCGVCAASAIACSKTWTWLTIEYPPTVEVPTGR